MKIIIAGCRNFNDYEFLKEKVSHAIKNINKDKIEIVSGGAKGVDSLGEAYAAEFGLKCKIFPADWEKNGKAAGHIRNAQMGDYADALIAFWDGESRGTKHMIKYAKNKKLQVKIYKITL
jgi:hypothetical protein